MAEGSGPLIFVVFVGTIMVLCGIIGGVFAGLKNRDYSYWIAWTFLMPPSLLVLLLLPKLKGVRPRAPSVAEQERRLGDM